MCFNMPNICFSMLYWYTDFNLVCCTPPPYSHMSPGSQPDIYAILFVIGILWYILVYNGMYHAFYMLFSNLFGMAFFLGIKKRAKSPFLFNSIRKCQTVLAFSSAFPAQCALSVPHSRPGVPLIPFPAPYHASA